MANGGSSKINNSPGCSISSQVVLTLTEMLMENTLMTANSV